jgi:hypothetical protein
VCRRYTQCSVDIGTSKATIEPSSGRVQYLGVTMNRAARIGQYTRTGQVWCTTDVWDAAQSQIQEWAKEQRTNQCEAAPTMSDHIAVNCVELGEHRVVPEPMSPRCIAAIPCSEQDGAPESHENDGMKLMDAHHM